MRLNRRRSEDELNYDRCTIAELRSFVRNRTGKDAAPSSGRTRLRQRLQNLDNKATFRFLDLPADIRNMVYEELLAPQYGEIGYAYRQTRAEIALTSREVMDEAGSILWQSCIITLGRQYPGYSRGPMTYSARPFWLSLEYRRSPSKDLFSYWQQFRPTSIKYVEHIQLEVFAPNAFGIECKEMNLALYTLVARVSPCNRVRTMRVMIKNEQITNPEPLKAVLWPLSNLDPRIAIEYENLDGETIRYIEQRRQQQSSRSYDIIGMAIDVRRKALETTEILRQAGSYEVQVAGLEGRLEAIKGVFDIMGEATDSAFSHALASLDDELKSVEVTKAVEDAQKLVGGR